MEFQGLWTLASDNRRGWTEFCGWTEESSNIYLKSKQLRTPKIHLVKLSLKWKMTIKGGFILAIRSRDVWPSLGWHPRDQKVACTTILSLRAENWAENVVHTRLASPTRATCPVFVHLFNCLVYGDVGIRRTELLVWSPLVAESFSHLTKRLSAVSLPGLFGFYIKDRLDIEKFPMSSSTQKALEGGGKDILVGGRRFGQCGNIEDKAKMCLRKPNL